MENGEKSGLGKMIRLVFVANLNKYNNKMEHSKSQKPLAYAYKAATGKISLQEQHKKAKRNSTGNLYELIVQQSRSQDKNYYQQLIKRNEREEQKSLAENMQVRKKANADIVIQNVREKIEKAREERETMCKPNKTKQMNDGSYLQQFASKNASGLNKKSKNKNQASHVFSNTMLVHSYKLEPQKSDVSFLQHLSNYLQDLSQSSDFLPQMRCNQKLSETMKISGKEGEARLLSKLQQYNLKIKELKLKNYYQQKEIDRYCKKQRKMNDCLFSMFDEITTLKKKVAAEQRQRMKLQQLIENFQIRRKPERRTIGKHYQISNEDDQNYSQQDSEYERERESSFHHYLMKKSMEKVGKGFTYDRNDFLDSEKVEKMFRSKFNSDQDQQ